MQRLDISGLPRAACYFTVIDAQGNSLLGLAESDFSIQVDGVPQKIQRLSSALDSGRFLSVALLLDGSGSMRGNLEKARQAAAAFIGRTSRQDQVAVFSCNEALTLHQDFSSDRELTRRALDPIQARGNTALFDAACEILKRFKASAAPRRALVMLTDGKDNRSHTSVDDVIRLAGEVDVSLYAIGLGPAIDDQGLRNLAAGTGGEFFRAAKSEDLLAMYRRIGEYLSNQYILEFNLSFASDGRTHDLTLEYLAPKGERPVLRRPFLAAVSPTMAPSAMAAMKDRVQQMQLFERVLPGLLLGMLAGLLFLAALKLLRPALPFCYWTSLALLIAMTLLGGILAALWNWQ